MSVVVGGGGSGRGGRGDEVDEGVEVWGVGEVWWEGDGVRGV